jgi:hypothetical protein
MRKTLPFVAVAALLWPASPASADQPIIVRHDHFEYATPAPYGVSCDSFDVWFTASADHTWMDFYDKSGSLARETLHFTFTGTLYKGSDLSMTVPYEGRGYFVWDFQHGREMWHYNYTATIDGNSVKVVAGADAYYYETFQYFFHGLADWAPVCAALA